MQHMLNGRAVSKRKPTAPLHRVVRRFAWCPQAEQNRTLFFRGQRNLDAVVDELVEER